MPQITPMDIFNKDFRTAMRGYDKNEVDQFLDLVLQSYEEVLEENEKLKEEVRQLKRGNRNMNGQASDMKVYEDVIQEILARLERLEKVTFGG